MAIGRFRQAYSNLSWNTVATYAVTGISLITAGTLIKMVIENDDVSPQQKAAFLSGVALIGAISVFAYDLHTSNNFRVVFNENVDLNVPANNEEEEDEFEIENEEDDFNHGPVEQGDEFGEMMDHLGYESSDEEVPIEEGAENPEREVRRHKRLLARNYILSEQLDALLDAEESTLLSSENLVDLKELLGSFEGHEKSIEQKKLDVYMDYVNSFCSISGEAYNEIIDPVTINHDRPEGEDIEGRPIKSRWVKTFSLEHLKQYINDCINKAVAAVEPETKDPLYNPAQITIYKGYPAEILTYVEDALALISLYKEQQAQVEIIIHNPVPVASLNLYGSFFGRSGNGCAREQVVCNPGVEMEQVGLGL